MVTERCIEWAETALRNGQRASPVGPEALSQLTLVIPSFRRQDYLMRQVVYWAHSRATLIIVDGSPQSIGPRAEAFVRGIPNIVYVHSGDTYVNRIRQASGLVRTPYAMCLADDDLFLMTGLGHAIECLNARPDLTICVGQAIAIDFDHRAGRASFFPYGASLRNYQVVHPDASERIRLGIDNYRAATCYAVVRSPAFAEIWRDIQPTSCPWTIEYEHAIGTYTVGSLAAVDDVYWLRSSECESIMPVRPDFATWWSTQEYRSECIRYVNRQAAKLVRCSSLTEQEARDVVLEAVEYIVRGRHTGLMNPSASVSMVGRFMSVIRSSRLLTSCWNGIKSTRIGGVARDRIMARLRRASETPSKDALLGMTEDVAGELTGVLAFMAEFHAARRLSAEG